MRDIEFCAGMGGMAIALQSAGFNKSNKMYEIDKPAHQSLLNNSAAYGGIIHGEPIHADIKQLDWEQVTEGEEIRLLSAGLPCQPFSIGGRRKGAEDSRDLFPVFFDAMAHMKPQVVLIENVRGLAAGGMKEYLKFIIDNLSCPPRSKLEYSVSYKVCNAADYGVPQLRHRIIIVAVRKDIQSSEFVFPRPTHSASALIKYIENGKYWEQHSITPRACTDKLKQMALTSNEGSKPWVTVRDVFSDLGKPSRCNNDTAHYYIPGGKLYKGHTGSQIDMPSKALKAGMNGNPGGENIVSYSNGKCRYFTLREMGKIQGFPDDYKLKGTRSQISKQLGNTIPIPLLYYVAKSLHRYVYLR